MPDIVDLTPATERLARVVRAVPADRLDAPTPCAGLTVADLLQHVDGLAGAFAGAARKQPQPGGPTADGTQLPADWPERIPARLADLSAAWREAAAWDGMTEVGGLTLPGSVAAAVGAAEVIVHGWDLAIATGQPFEAEDEQLQLALTFVEPTVAQSPEGTPGLFGAAVPVAADAPPLQRLLGLTGRDPEWTR